MNPQLRLKIIAIVIAVPLTLGACGTKEAKSIATSLKDGAPAAQEAIGKIKAAAETQVTAHLATRAKLKTTLQDLHQALVQRYAAELDTAENQLDKTLAEIKVEAMETAAASVREKEAGLGEKITLGLINLRGSVLAFRTEARRLVLVVEKPENRENMVIQREAAVANQRYASALVTYRELQLKAWNDWRAGKAVAESKFRVDLATALETARARVATQITAQRTALAASTCCDVDLGPDPTFAGENYAGVDNWLGQVASSGAQLERYFDQPKMLPKAFISGVQDELKKLIPFNKEETGDTPDLKTGLKELKEATGLDKIEEKITEIKADGKITISDVVSVLGSFDDSVDDTVEEVEDDTEAAADDELKTATNGS